MAIPSKISERLSAGIKRFQPILAGAKSRDVNESDTVIILTDMLADVFGFDKYSELTSEFSIRGTYCDLAIKLGGKVMLLIEAKAIGTDLRENHTKQAVDYAANQGIEWVVLTNAIQWEVYRVVFAQPISQEKVLEFSFENLDPRLNTDRELLFMLTKEGLTKSRLDDYHTQKQAMSRFFLGAMLLSDSILAVLRRELKRVSPNVKIECEDVARVLQEEVIKREVLESDAISEARRKIQKAQGRMLRNRSAKGVDHSPPTNDISEGSSSSASPNSESV